MYMYEQQPRALGSGGNRKNADGGVDNNHIICMVVAKGWLVMDAEVAEMVHPHDRDNE